MKGESELNLRKQKKKKKENPKKAFDREGAEHQCGTQIPRTTS